MVFSAQGEAFAAEGLAPPINGALATQHMAAVPAEVAPPLGDACNRAVHSVSVEDGGVSASPARGGGGAAFTIEEHEGYAS